MADTCAQSALRAAVFTLPDTLGLAVAEAAELRPVRAHLCLHAQPRRRTLFHTLVSRLLHGRPSRQQQRAFCKKIISNQLAPCV